ncbi:hypothetical protein MVEN_01652100 [Mycena venus]|uniref:Acid proteinase n=1 Tax=Mycena venus TaxID=2733690 RepID=A0A8H6XPP9_9AGAR|nr:hypothetical protein MVEN_01652100 [Mycena venus]
MKAAHSLVFISSILLVSSMPVDNLSGAASDTAGSTDTVTLGGSSSLSTSAAVASSTPSESSSTTGGSSGLSSLTFAIDEDSGAVIAYDGTGKNLGNSEGKISSTFGSGRLGMGGTVTQSSVNTCRPATQDDLAHIPGWNAFVAGVTAWANGDSGQLLREWQDTEYGATVCYSTDKVKMSVTGSPSCSTTATLTNGTSDGVDTAMSASVLKGTSTTYQITTEETSSFEWSQDISASVDIEGAADVGITESRSLTVSSPKGTMESKTDD